MSLLDRRIIALSAKLDTRLYVHFCQLLSRTQASVFMSHIMRQNVVGTLQQQLASHQHNAPGRGVLAIIALTIQGSDTSCERSLCLPDADAHK